jgi:hypothetical protein
MMVVEMPDQLGTLIREQYERAERPRVEREAAAMAKLNALVAAQIAAERLAHPKNFRYGRPRAVRLRRRRIRSTAVFTLEPTGAARVEELADGQPHGDREIAI